MLNGLYVIDQKYRSDCLKKIFVLTKMKYNLNLTKGKLLLFYLIVSLTFGFFINSFISSEESSEKNSKEFHHNDNKLASKQNNLAPIVISLKNRILADDTSTSDTIQKYVILLLIVFFVVVPVTAILIIAGLFIYKKCQQRRNQSQQEQGHIESVNLDSYNIDEIGPYIANSNDQCSICLDTQVNLRTFCGHFFHAPCLKTWFDKKALENRRSTCPVCIGRVTNPVKIYCKKCFVSVKLDKLLTSSTQQEIIQLSAVECNQCKKSSNNNSFSQSQLTENPQINKKPNNQKQKQKYAQGNGMTSDVKINVNHQI